PEPQGLTRFRVVPFQPGSRTSHRTLRRSTRDAGGLRDYARRARKNSFRRARQSFSATPAVTAIRLLRRGTAQRATTDPAAAPFGSAHPYTRRPTRAFSAAPTHIAHGSTVT